MNEFETMQQTITEMDPTSDHIFLAKFPEPDEDTLEITILDSYHQGVTLVLKKDGTFTSWPTGG